LDPETNVVKYADAEMRMVVFAVCNTGLSNPRLTDPADCGLLYSLTRLSVAFVGHRRRPTTTNTTFSIWWSRQTP
jgi:hypothetical protein